MSHSCAPTIAAQLTPHIAHPHDCEQELRNSLFLVEDAIDRIDPPPPGLALEPLSLSYTLGQLDRIIRYAVDARNCCDALREKHAAAGAEPVLTPAEFKAELDALVLDIGAMEGGAD